MKKFFIPLIIFIVIFFFIGLFFSKKETPLKIIKENQEQKEVSTSSSSEISGKTESLFILEFERKVNEDASKLTEKIKPDENKSITTYRAEVAKTQQKFNAQKETQQISPDFLIGIAQDLSKINPPPLFYSFHLELTKIFYKLGIMYKELYNINDPVKKMLLYNLIKTTLEKIKF
jgi:hypothetical protein